VVLAVSALAWQFDRPQTKKLCNLSIHVRDLSVAVGLLLLALSEDFDSDVSKNRYIGAQSVCTLTRTTRMTTMRPTTTL
jgi:hypothetical protein